MTGHQTLVYLFGIAGHPAPSPALGALEDAGWRVVVPDLPGFDGRSGFTPPDDYLGWLTVLWDALDATGALPCPVVGASVGGMLAADLAALRPEVVSALALLAPFGIFDAAHPGSTFRRARRRADGPPVRQGRARAVRRSLRPLGRRRRPGGPLPQRRRRRQPALAARRPRPGPPAPPHHAARRWCCGVSRTSCSRRAGADVGRRGRRPSTSSPVPAICSNGTRPTRSPPASSAFLG